MPEWLRPLRSESSKPVKKLIKAICSGDSAQPPMGPRSPLVDVKAGECVMGTEGHGPCIFPHLMAGCDRQITPPIKFNFTPLR